MSPIAYANPSTFVAGNVLTAAQQNVLANNDRFLHGPPTVRLRRAAAQTFTISAYDTVQFDTEDWDSNSMWSSTNNDQVFVRTAGKYLATFSGSFSNSTGGTLRIIAIVKNSTASLVTNEQFQVFASQDMLTLGPRMSVTGMFSMTTTDYLTAQMFQDAGSITATTAREGQPTFSMLWVSS